MGPILQLIGCTNIQEPFDPTSIEWQKDNVTNVFISDAMPLVAPITLDKAQELYPGDEYLKATAKYYETHEQFVDFIIGAIQTRSNIDFQEYILTHTSTTPQPVYALTTGYLYYLTAGQALPSVLGGTEVGTNETVLVLLPMPRTLEDWKDKQPGKQPLLNQCAYLNIDLISDTCSSDSDISESCLKKLVRTSTTKKYYEKIYTEYTGNELPDTDNWEDIFIQLFKERPEVPLVVKGGAQIGWTKAVSETSATQSMKMFFSFNTIWNSSPDDITRPFFKYFKRNAGLGGHPLIAKLLNQTVMAGTVDVIMPKYATGVRFKSTLIEEYKNMEFDGVRTHHPLAINTDQHPIRVIVPKFPEIDPVYSHLSIWEDQKLTWLKISNPLNLTINIEGDIPPEVIISPLAFQEKEQIVEIKIVGDLPIIAGNEVTIQFMVQEPSGFSSEAFRIVLTFMDFFAVPVKFYKLLNTNHATIMNESDLLEVIASANEILGRQTNVYIYPLEEEGIILHSLEYTAADLGNPIYDKYLTAGHGLNSIWDLLKPTIVMQNIRVTFVWNLEVTGDTIGLSYCPGNFKDWRMIFIDTIPQDPFDALVASLAKTLVHELGHWFSTTFIVNINQNDQCTQGDEHFRHVGCAPGGDLMLQGNIMGESADNLWITYDQAKVYNTYANEVLP